MKILYLFPKSLADSKMSLGRILYGEAIGRLPGVELAFWGSGWPGYRDDLDLRTNLAIADINPDVCLFYKAGTLKRAWDIDALRVVCMNEANDAKKNAADWDPCRPDLIVYHHPNDLERFDAESPGPKKIHLPHCADESFFPDPPPLADRPIDCLLTGVHAPAVYPLRARLRGLMQSGAIKGNCVVRNHPGYRLNGMAALREQYADYCRQLMQAKVALCCCSIWRYPLAKQQEAAMAGCLVVSDMFDGFNSDTTAARSNLDRLYDWISPIDMGDSDAAICTLINDLIEDRPQRFADRARSVAIEELTTRHYAERFVTACREEIERQRTDPLAWQK